MFHVRLDAAGQYAANLEAVLHQLPFEKTVSIGDPVRNKNYRVAHFPKSKSDAIESHCVARFAVIETDSDRYRLPRSIPFLCMNRNSLPLALKSWQTVP